MVKVMGPSHRDERLSRTPTPLEAALLMHERDCKIRLQLAQLGERTDQQVRALAEKTEKRFDDVIATVAQNSERVAGLSAAVKLGSAIIVLAIGMIGGLSVWAIRGIASAAAPKVTQVQTLDAGMSVFVAQNRKVP
jgi:hypothetical protein